MTLTLIFLMFSNVFCMDLTNIRTYFDETKKTERIVFDFDEDAAPVYSELRNKKLLSIKISDVVIQDEKKIQVLSKIFKKTKNIYTNNIILLPEEKQIIVELLMQDASIKYNIQALTSKSRLVLDLSR